MGNVTSLDWHAKPEEIEQADFINDDFYMYKNTLINPLNHPFKANKTICCICLKGEISMAGSRKLGRTSDHRKAMLRGMVTLLLEKGKIVTTVARAKEVRSAAEKMITLGKKGDLAAYRQALSFITREDVANKLFKELAPSYAERNGGYTRIIRTGVRRGDAAETAIIELVK